MLNADVKICPGFAQTTIKGQNYVSEWTVHVQLPNDTRYAVSVLTRGEGDTLSGLNALDYWRNGDPNTLLEMWKSGTVDGEWQEGKLSVEDARKIKKVLGNVKEGNQPVTNQFDRDVPTEYRDLVVNFLEPRIVIGAGMLDEYCTVRLGDIDDKLREEREGREGPSLPRA